MSECYDCNGRPICPGDLLRTFHFVGPRNQKFWLYHVAVPNGDHMEGVPVSYLCPTVKDTGGRFWLKERNEQEIIHGVNPWWTDRKRVKFMEDTNAT